MEERKTVRSHILTVENRKNGKLTGVQEVDSFNENEMLLLTVEGKLLIKGEQLHIKGLDLEKEEALIEGKINSLSYITRNKPVSKESLLKRMFR